MTSGGDRLDAALAELWREQRPEMMRRVDVVEAALRALAAGGLDQDGRAEAQAAAHKIAGAAGSFGFADASRSARQLELALRADPARENAAGLSKLVAAIRDDFNRI